MAFVLLTTARAQQLTTATRSQYLPFGRPDFGAEEIDAVSRVMRGGWVGMGQETVAFEQELAAYAGAPHVVTVNSCTSALFLSLLVSNVGPDDEVICPSLTWCSTANAALYLGARPVFCDVEPHTLSVSPETVTRHLTPRTKAVMVVHMGGLAADVEAIRAALPSHVAIIEDAAHALGALYGDGTPVGSSGNLTCFSFYANKNLSTGEGGAVALFDASRADRLRSLRQHGLSADAWKRFTHPQSALSVKVSELGYKMNYTDLQASIGRVQLRRQHEFATRRLALARRYADALRDSPLPLDFQHKVLDHDHARHLLVVTLPAGRMCLTRNEVLLALRNRNIGASVHYAPLHMMPAYAGSGRLSLPHTEALMDRIMTLPISASMTDADVDYVAGHLIDVLGTTVSERAAS
ncbi:MAG TPA: DegT/DnrJ/EryC1/StrS aminotransferase family protein [Vicinamibacterales bacterium]|nr:DegT/DnrJ/EryC1/StrS aminotransferase family protein [Vicinamibacterales bacterium]